MSGKAATEGWGLANGHLQNWLKSFTNHLLSIQNQVEALLYLSVALNICLIEFSLEVCSHWPMTRMGNNVILDQFLVYGLSFIN